MTIRKVGVIGAGQMGNGIAHICALAGYDVGLNDLSKDQIEEGLATINGNLARQCKSGRISEDERSAAIGRIQPVGKLEGFGDFDLVFESATEDENVKRQIFADLCPHLREDTIVGSNTSSISITRLAASTDRPERFMGFIS